MHVLTICNNYTKTDFHFFVLRLTDRIYRSLCKTVDGKGWKLTLWTVAISISIIQRVLLQCTASNVSMSDELRNTLIQGYGKKYMIR